MSGTGNGVGCSTDGDPGAHRPRGSRRASQFVAPPPAAHRAPPGTASHQVRSHVPVEAIAGGLVPVEQFANPPDDQVVRALG
ncbi:hypothetical protein [Kineococcus sp. SYSU DK002]|uniref:hypothetical protein n=1 Tax=Kineococcus sp. SYSU DK002 TaxID=3383123 RepID=UPI003D7DC98D